MYNHLILLCIHKYKRQANQNFTAVPSVYSYCVCRVAGLNSDPNSINYVKLPVFLLVVAHPRDLRD